MATKSSKYQYETSPRKLKPEYEPYIKTLTPKKDNKSKKTNNTKKNKQTIRSKVKVVTYIVIGFSIMFAVCYRNAQIDEKFSKVQSLKQEMSNMDKQNAQLEIAIESGLNFNNLEKQAKELLGMQKLNSKQTIYVEAPNVDYIQAATEEVKIDEEKGFFKKIFNTLSEIL